MKVLYFMNHVDQGGAALALYDLIVELKRTIKGYHPIVVTGKNNTLNKMFTEINVENYSADFKNFLSSYKNPLCLTRPALMFRYSICMKRAINQIERKIDFTSINLIHSNLNRIDIGAILAEKHKIPHIWHIREHANIYTGFFHLKPAVEPIDFNLVSVKQNPVQYMNGFNLVSVKQNYFIAISQSVKNEWIRKGVEKNRIRLIYDGIRTELYENVETQTMQSEIRKAEIQLRMIFLGGYCKEKGQEELIKALFKLLPSERQALHVDFYGSGNKNYINYLKKFADELIASGTVSFNSYDPKISSRLYTYDIGFNCSNAEGFGRVTVEYMMAGLCPIVSSTGANPEIVDDGINGIVYQKGNIDDLCKKIRVVLSEKEKTIEYGRAAQRKAINLYSMTAHAKSIMELYRKILNI